MHLNPSRQRFLKVERSPPPPPFNVCVLHAFSHLILYGTQTHIYLYDTLCTHDNNNNYYSWVLVVNRRPPSPIWLAGSLYSVAPPLFPPVFWNSPPSYYHLLCFQATLVTACEPRKKWKASQIISQCLHCGIMIWEHIVIFTHSCLVKC